MGSYLGEDGARILEAGLVGIARTGNIEGWESQGLGAMGAGRGGGGWTAIFHQVDI